MKLTIQNPERLPKDLCIFYCWQDHLDGRLHRFLVRDALTTAVKILQQEMPAGANCVLRLDSDTADRAGAVDIANTILQKINESTIVVGDVTPVLKNKERGGFYPNPNVMMEIGYAAKALGWSRIVNVFNECDCKAEDLPFDIRHRRLSPYKCTDVSGRAQAEKELSERLIIAISAVMTDIDRGVFDATLGDSAIRRSRDLRLLYDVMHNIHRPSMDRFVEDGLRDSYYDDCQFFWLGFEAIVCSSNFRFYDKILENLIDEFWHAWGRVEHHARMAFHPIGNPRRFGFKPHHYWTPEYEKLVEELRSFYIALPVAFKRLLDYIHLNYVEIDMIETDEVAWARNLPYIRGDNFNKGGTTDNHPTQTHSGEPVVQSIGADQKRELSIEIAQFFAEIKVWCQKCDDLIEAQQFPTDAALQEGGKDLPPPDKTWESRCVSFAGRSDASGFQNLACLIKEAERVGAIFNGEKTLRRQVTIHALIWQRIPKVVQKLESKIGATSAG